MALPAGAARVACAVLHVGPRTAVVKHDGRAKVIDAVDVLSHDAGGVVVTAAGAAELAGPPPTRCITDAELALRFGKSVDWLYRNFNALVAEEGFPRPVSGRGRRRHAADLVDAWFRRDQRACPPTTQAAPDRQAAAPAAGGRVARSFAEPLEHGEAARRELDEEDAAWRVALAGRYGSDSR